MVINVCLWKTVRTSPGRIPDESDWNLQEDKLEQYTDPRSRVSEAGMLFREKDAREFRVALPSGATHRIIRGVNRNY